MQELMQLLSAIDDAKRAGKPAALATVVRVKGSAYRREGTKMLIDADGKQVCMISGGCLEAEVAEIAQQVIQSGKPVLQAFDLAEDVVWGLGLGCGGAVDVYIEAFDESAAYQAWLEAVKQQQSACLASIIETEKPAGSLSVGRLFIAADGQLTGSLGTATLDQELRELALGRMRGLYPRSFIHHVRLADHGDVAIFLDFHVPAAELLIFGAGHDAIPLANLAHTLGLRVSIIDARPAFVTPERFPQAERLIRTHPSGFNEHVRIQARSYVMVMNHHLERDTASLAFALRSPAAYIGVLGPRQRYQDMLDALQEDGQSFSEAQLSRVRNPVGVDIGADTPQEIAVSIMAELTALRGGYGAGFLSDRDGFIHKRLELPA